MNSKKYNLSGGSKVTVFDPSSDKRVSIAVVEMDGDYPEKGYAVNQNQAEGVFVIDGELTFSVDDVKTICHPGDVIYFPEGAHYTVSGKGKAVVAVAPAGVGETKIVDQAPS